MITNEELFREVNKPPAVRISKRLAAMLKESAAVAEPETEFCLNPVCFNSFPAVPKWTNRGGKRVKIVPDYCSRNCALAAYTTEETRRKGGRQTAAVVRGRNPERHIATKVKGERWYLHRLIVFRERGHLSRTDEIVHHRDENKHHNCYGACSCEPCGLRLLVLLLAVIDSRMAVAHLYFRHGCTNLEVLTGEAMKRHLNYHRGAQGRAHSRRNRK